MKWLLNDGSIKLRPETSARTYAPKKLQETRLPGLSVNYLLVFLATAPATAAAKAAQSSLGEKRSTFAATNTA